MKSIFQFTNTTTAQTAHIIEEGCVYSLVNEQGEVVSNDEICCSPMAQILVMTAKKLGYKMTGIKHFDIVFAQITEQAIDQITEAVEAVVSTVVEIANVVSDEAQDIVQAQNDDNLMLDQIQNLKNIVASAEKMISTLESTMKVSLKCIDKVEEALDDTSHEILLASLYETEEERIKNQTESMIEQAYYACLYMCMDAKIEDDNWDARRKQPNRTKDRLLLSYGDTEYMLILKDCDSDTVTLYQFYDRKNGGGEYVTEHTGLMDLISTIEDDMIAFDRECQKWNEQQGN